MLENVWLLRGRSQIIFATYYLFVTLGGILQRDRGRSGRAVHCVLEHSLKVENTLPLVLSH